MIILYFLWGLWSWGYHHFASFGYMSCLTCHYNAGGSGPLSEYGRALWAAELSSRWYVPKRISDDRLGEKSDFFFGNAPRFFKPHLKIRSLGLVKAPDTPRQATQNYWMQRELGFASHWDANDRWITVVTWSFNDKWGAYRTSTSSASELNPQQTPKTWLKEFYARVGIRENWWIFVGQMDKPFGIRDANHTLFQRRIPKVTQYDQSLGVLLFWDLPQWEVQIMGFQGNIHEKPNKALGGGVLWAERKQSDKWRWGLSGLAQSNVSLEQLVAAIWNRFQLGRTSTHLELGFSNELNRVSKKDENQIYLLAQHFVRLERGIYGLAELDAGYHLQTGVNQGFLGLHFIFNILYRSEFRFGGVLPAWSQGLSSPPDSVLQVQWHLSW